MTKINVYGTCISYRGDGILFIGPTGSGKSDIALRMIMDKHALLVADDRTDLEVINGRLTASCPTAISGQMEVRGVGICVFETEPSVPLTLVVELVAEKNKVERLPPSATAEYLGVTVPKISLYAFESSVVDKIILACYQNK